MKQEKLDYSDKQAEASAEKIDQCFICKDWFLEGTLKVANLKESEFSYHPYVKKPICKRCLERIRERSAGKSEPLYLCEHDGG